MKVKIDGIEIEAKGIEVEGKNITVYNSYFAPASIKIGEYKIVVVSTT